MFGAGGWQELSRPARRSRRARSPFSSLALAHALSVAGDTFVTMALAGSLFFDISPNAARERVALSLLLTMAPFAVVAPLLGPAIDRRRGGRRMTLVLAAAARAATAVYLAEVLHEPLLFAAAFGQLVLSKTHAVAKSALVPTVVSSDEELVRANARLALGAVVVGLVAALPGIAVLRLAGSVWAVRVAALVFAAAAVAAARIVPLRPEEGAGRATSARPALTPGVRLAGTAIAVLRGGVGFLTFLLAFALRRDGAPSWLFGALLAASMAGSFAGNALAPRVRRSLDEERTLTAALALVAGVAGLAARSGSPLSAAFVAAALGVAASAGKLSFEAIVQRDARGPGHGRQFARFETEMQLAWVVGALVPVLLPVPVGTGFAVLAFVTTLAGIGYVSGRWAVGTPRMS